jgi:hypothetical protein
MDWIGFLGALIKLVVLLVDRYRKTPNERRREALADFDKALEAAQKDDLTLLSKWLGKKL